MTRGEVGARPLILDTIKRILPFSKRGKKHRSSIVYPAVKFDPSHVFSPNFNLFISKFNIKQYNAIISMIDILKRQQRIQALQIPSVSINISMELITINIGQVYHDFDSQL